MGFYKKPKCPNCYTALIQIYTRIGDKGQTIGYMCKICNKYFIFKKYGKFKTQLYIGLKEIKE